MDDDGVTTLCVHSLWRKGLDLIMPSFDEESDSLLQRRGLRVKLTSSFGSFIFFVPFVKKEKKNVGTRFVRDPKPRDYFKFSVCKWQFAILKNPRKSVNPWPDSGIVLKFLSCSYRPSRRADVVIGKY